MSRVNGYYEVITPAGTDPITLVEAKAFLRIETTADDTLVTTMIKAATLSAEKYMNRTIVTRTLRASYPNTEANATNRIQTAPVSAITIAEIWNSVTDVFDTTTDFVFQQGSGFPCIIWGGGAVGHPDDNAFGVRVTFTAGYTTVPEDIKQAIKAHVAFLYENRGDVAAIDGEQLPGVSKLIYRQYRIIGTYG